MKLPNLPKIVCGQMDLLWENKHGNFEKVRGLLDHCDASPASMLVLPEMFSTGFSMNVPLIREQEPSETEAFLSSLAREKRISVVGGIVSKGRDNRGRNEAVAFDARGELIARYCKLHPFTFGGESEYYEPGSAIVTFPWNGFVVAPFVCYDLRFPEVFRVATKKGATMFLVIANWPSRRVHHWIALLRARAIENQAYAVGVNRCGSDPKLEYPGRSVVVDPQGEIIADAGDSEVFLSAEVDVNTMSAWRAEFPALKDIHSNFLGDG